MSSSVSLVQVMDRLDACIQAAEEVLAENTHVTVDYKETIALARKITPSINPPQGLRFTIDGGPLEPMPPRFRLPYPTLDEMRASAVFLDDNNASKAIQTPMSVDPQPVIQQPITQQQPVSGTLKLAPEDEDFQDDF